MRLRRTVVLVLAGLLLLSGLNVLRAERKGDGDFVAQFPGGEVNWSTGLVRVKGRAEPKEGGKALEAALAAARAKLLAVLKDLWVTSETRLAKLLAAAPEIKTQLESLIEGAQQIDRFYCSDGSVQVVLAMSFKGAFSQLVLPANIVSIAQVKPLAKQGEAKPKPGYSGLVVDARGIGCQPALAPRILDEDGQELYGPSYVSREFAVQWGVAGYTRDLQVARSSHRVSPDPLVVRGIRTAGQGRSDIVISNAEAGKLKEAAANLEFLQRCLVVIVLD